MQQEEGLYLSEGKAFQDYLLTGGMPFLSHLPKEEDAIFNICETSITRSF